MSQEQQQQEQPQLIDNEQQLIKVYSEMQKKCALIEDFQDPGMKNQQIIQKFLFLQRCIQKLNIFSENQKLTDIKTEYLKQQYKLINVVRFICLPYHVGFVFGKITQPRKQSILQQKSYLLAFMNLCNLFNCEDEQIFPKNAQIMWKNITESTQVYKPSRDELVTSMKQKKVIQTRYKNSTKIKDSQEQRQSIKDFITLRVYEAITMLRMITQEMEMLKYKDSLQNDPEVRQRHEEQTSRPVPKMKVWDIKKPQQITEQLLGQLPQGYIQPKYPLLSQKKQKIAQVWQQNANKPTMTLQQVGQLQYDNMVQRTERQQKQAQQNKVDTDSDKEEVDHRQKKQARNWDDWKDMTEKGVGNRNKGMR